MADWYASSAAYALIPAFVPSAVYTLGQFVKPTAPTFKSLWAFRCTTAGTASTEPSWPNTNNATITTGGATFTNITGQSTYGWSAAAGDLQTLLGGVGPNRFAAGDRMFVSSDHSETQISNTTYGSSAFIVASYTVCQVLSVNRAGSVPPVAADLLPGATVAVGGSGVAMVIDALCPVYYYGMNFVFTGTIVNGISFSSGGSKSHYFDTCQIYINTTVASAAIFANNPAVITLYNSSIRFGHTSQFIRGGGNNQSFEINWLNTSSPFGGGVVPAVLFNPQAAKFLVTARGVDFSALNTIMVQEQTSSTVGQGGKFLFDSCRIASGVTRYSTANMGNCTAVVELVNCYDGTSFLSETHQPTGDVTTEFTITLSGGAQDNVGTFSHKMVSNTNIDKYANTLTSFWMDTNNATIGGPRTATVEFISSASLNNDEISLLLEYEGTAGSSLASIVTTMPATVLTTPTAVPTSTATWNSSPATPVRQHLQVTFTPQVLGRVRGQIRLGKPSTTVYVDPRLILT